MVRLTKEQRKALFKIFQRDFPSWVSPTKRWRGDIRTGIEYVKTPSIQYRRFRAKVVPYLGDNSCVMLPWKGMWLGIERDGHIHS